MTVDPKFPTYIRGVVRVADTPFRQASATVTSVAGSASSVTLLAVNKDRIGATFFNDSTADLYLKCGATASTSSFTVKITAGSFYTLTALPSPYDIFRGIIDGIWSSATGNVRITEFTRS